MVQSEQQEKKGRELSDQELKEMKKGFDLESTIGTAGWEVINQMLVDRAFHTWINPIGTTKEEWEWAELNAFHSADVSKQLLESIREIIERAHYLKGVQIGEITEGKRMKI